MRHVGIYDDMNDMNDMNDNFMNDNFAEKKRTYAETGKQSAQWFPISRKMDRGALKGFCISAALLKSR